MADQEWDRDPEECPHGIYRGANTCPVCDMRPDLYLYTDLGFGLCISPHRPAEWEGRLVRLPWSEAQAHVHHYPTRVVRFTQSDQSYAVLRALLES